ncbi:MAG: CoA transferase [Chloroflexota bacterium]|nr:MAG: CoA transferase [Chloroflexota bacterium]
MIKPSALDGLIVLDLARRYPGAYSTMFLADFGARVIKVDPPGTAFPVANMDTTSEKFAAFYAPDRNKETIVLDLKSEGGREVFYKLVQKADVVVEGFRPGVMKRLKADYDVLSKLNSRLIHCSLTGFGHSGPYGTMPAHDSNFIALGGVLSFVGPSDGAPCLPGHFLADMAGAGLHGLIGILLALAAREKTGKGQFVDVSYLDGTISMLALEASYYFLTGQIPRRGETIYTGGAVWNSVYKCKDGEYITLGSTEAHMWENVCRLLGREDLIPHQNPSSPEERDRVRSILTEIFLGKTRDEWFELSRGKDICLAPVLNIKETFEDPQVLHRQMVAEIDHPALGKVQQIGIPIKLSETPGEIRSLGKVLGADSDKILRELGYDDEDVRSLRSAGAVS